MSEADRIKAIFDAIDLLAEAPGTAIHKADKNVIYFMLMWPKWRRLSERIRRAQYHLLNQLDMGGWNCFR